MVREYRGGIPVIRFLTAVAVCVGSLLLPGCMETPGEPVDTYLVKVGGSTLSVSDFNDVFEISKTAYSHSDTMDLQVVADMKLRLLNQLIEELILLERAGAAGISISDGELESEVQKIKADYPEGVFEEMLLEAAVSFEAWKKRLKMQLVARKFIQAELESKITITTEEVARYYEQHFSDDTGPGMDDRQPDIQLDGQQPDGQTGGRQPAITDAMILRMLKNQKVQAAYTEWMKANRRKVTIDINSRQWDEITPK
ncbi:MAG: hypothetical protein GY697_09415 [Desulfobacterales bacterium]|nr:hypothetical protein [Desulfobacterales bacterium]